MIRFRFRNPVPTPTVLTVLKKVDFHFFLSKYQFQKVNKSMTVTILFLKIISSMMVFQGFFIKLTFSKIYTFKWVSSSLQNSCHYSRIFVHPLLAITPSILYSIHAALGSWSTYRLEPEPEPDPVLKPFQNRRTGSRKWRFSYHHYPTLLKTEKYYKHLLKRMDIRVAISK